MSLTDYIGLTVTFILSGFALSCIFELIAMGFSKGLDLVKDITK